MILKELWSAISEIASRMCSVVGIRKSFQSDSATLTKLILFNLVQQGTIFAAKIFSFHVNLSNFFTIICSSSSVPRPKRRLVDLHSVPRTKAGILSQNCVCMKIEFIPLRHMPPRISPNSSYFHECSARHATTTALRTPATKYRHDKNGDSGKNCGFRVRGSQN